jgi:DNA replication and repair protein RecF
VRLEFLRLFEFRNFDRLEIELRPRLNFFVGENGQGKTNLVEAVHLLSRGVSFRPATSQNFLFHRGSVVAPKARVDGRFVKGGLLFDVELTLEAGRKSALINGKKSNSGDLLRNFPTVLFSPESLAAIKEGPEQRRQLIDEIVLSCDPKQGQLLREYSRALKSRNRLLKNLAEGLGPRGDLEASLESLNRIYFLLSTHLTAARVKSLREILPAFREAMTFISEGTVGDISVDYVISGESALDWSESQIFDALQKRHSELAFSEMSYGGSLVGPHKHDIKFLLAGNDSRFYSSQGQQRALILALKIAQIVYHQSIHQTYPVLLLDDVLSELDSKKRENLMRFLEGVSAQILITSTDLAWSDHFGSDRNAIFEVRAGTVKARSEGPRENGS